MHSKRLLARPIVVIVMTVIATGGLLDLSVAQAGAAPVRPAPSAANPSSGCSTAGGSTAGDSTVSLMSAGLPRTYLQHVPPGYDGRHPVPLVVDLHGYGEGSAIESDLTGFGAYGDLHRFVTVTPQGRGAEAFWDSYLTSPDVRFVGDLLDHVEHMLCLDQRRIYVAGYSNGAFLASSVACVDANRVAAVAPVAGIEAPAGCKPSRRVPVVAFHGTADQDVAYAGGLGPKGLLLPAPDGSGRTLAQTGFFGLTAHGPSVPQILGVWAKRNGCGGSPAERDVASDVTLISYPCPRGAETELFRVTGGGHAWPGSAFSAAVASVVGPTTMSVSATALTWQFFQAHELPARR
jgi:polyhydroxybutyrate depolymerase